MSEPRTIVVVGATSGIGYETALRLNAAGHHVLAGGRNPRRLDDLQRTLSRNGGAAIACDISTRLGCADLVGEIAARADHVDALVNNAGLITRGRRESADGHELNLAVHHLAPFAVTSGLLPLLRKGTMPGGPEGSEGPEASEAARVVNVNSAGHQTSLGGHVNPSLDFDDLESRRAFNAFLAYSRSKLANLLFSYELARRHGAELVVNALHPGVVRSGIGREYPRWRVALAQLTSISPGRAAPAVTALATAPVGTNGGYYDRATPKRSSPPSYDRAAAARLWGVTERICGPFDAGS